jgi:hypothetical protein
MDAKLFSIYPRFMLESVAIAVVSEIFDSVLCAGETLMEPMSWILAVSMDQDFVSGSTSQLFWYKMDMPVPVRLPAQQTSACTEVRYLPQSNPIQSNSIHHPSINQPIESINSNPKKNTIPSKSRTTKPHTITA